MSLSKGIGEIPSMATCQAFVAYRTTTIVQYYFDSLSFASLTILTLLSVLAKKSFRKGKMPLVVLEIEIECSSDRGRGKNAPKYQIDILCWPFHAPKRPGQKYYTILVIIIVHIYYILIYFRSHFIASRLDRITLYIIRRRPQEKMVKIRDKIKNVTCTEWIHNYIL